jgi:hypothetical protein
MAASDQCMNWGSTGMTVFTSASCQRSFLLSFPGGGKDVILLDIRQKVVFALVRLLGSRLVLMVLLTSSRLRLRSSRELLSALLQLSHEPALTRGVGRFPARGAVDFARLVKRSIEGVLALQMPLTTAGSARTSLVKCRSL